MISFFVMGKGAGRRRGREAVIYFTYGKLGVERKSCMKEMA